jgi:protein tyrosine/serine phosphatase
MLGSSGWLRSHRYARGIFSAILFAACCVNSFADEAARPANWASAISGVEGLGNLFQVSPQLYRSRQPSAQALKRILAQHPLVDGTEPIRTVVALRVSDGGDGALLGGSDAVHYEWLKFNPFHPVDKDVIAFLRIVTDKASQPVLVHCAQGSDRTGMMVAIYRIVVQGWSKEDALKEMVDGGYGFHFVWQDLVHYVRNLDVDALKTKLAQAGPLQTATAPSVVAGAAGNVTPSVGAVSTSR